MTIHSPDEKVLYYNPNIAHIRFHYVTYLTVDVIFPERCHYAKISYVFQCSTSVKQLGNMTLGHSPITQARCTSIAQDQNLAILTRSLPTETVDVILTLTANTLQPPDKVVSPTENQSAFKLAHNLLKKVSNKPKNFLRPELRVVN